MKDGGVAVFPTDTVTGMGCLARSARGVRAVFRLKGRSARQPLILFAENLGQVERFTGPLSARVRALLRVLWPGAFTAVLPLAVRLPRGVGRGGTVGVRIPRHPVPLKMVRALGAPLATTSANLTGTAPLASAGMAGRIWGNRVSVFPGKSGAVPSTVADLTKWPPVVIREGRISRRKLDQLVKRIGGPRK